MALMDFVPVVFFGITASLLLRDLYNKMFKGAYALLAAGSVNVFMAGFFKALWKLLYAANICDFVALEEMFMPVNSLGLLFVGISIVGMLCRKKKSVMLYTYSVKNYPGYEGEVHVNLLVYKNTVIGGDVCSADVNGFVHGFEKSQ